MLTNTCILSYTEVVRKKAEKLYNEHRDSTANVVVLPKWNDLPEQSRFTWMRVAKCHEYARQNQLMP